MRSRMDVPRKRDIAKENEDTGESSKRRKLTPRDTLSRTSLSELSPDEVHSLLVRNGVHQDIARLFQEQKISGSHLFKLSHLDLKEIGIKKHGIRLEILETIQFLVNRNYVCEEKIFNDPIHGHIELHPLMVKIIDTPQFQRLRHINQLGGGYYVFIGASHNRFEHSIGVGYLAGELVETLRRKQPELHISKEDVLCVKIAGLCHDLGHGPFSHMFDNYFIPKINPQSTWRHEEASVMMFEHLLEVNNLGDDFEKSGLTEEDIIFIKEQIAGPNNLQMSSQPSSWPYRGRPVEKSFLYEIVANKRNGIDVDKWDYFARDCYSLGIPNNFDLGRFMKFARVIDVNSKRQICTRDKEVGNLYEMFHTRTSLHRRAYQHKTSKIIEYMLTEALVKANKYLFIPGKCGPTRMSDAIKDPYAYTRLTDFVFQQIIMSEDPNLNESKELLLKVERRQLYKFIGQTQRLNDKDKLLEGDDSGVIAEEIIASLSADQLDTLPHLKKEDLVVQVITYDYGMKEEDPVNHMRFYSKDNPNKAVKVRRDQVSQMLPHIFKEQNIRIYSRRLDPDGILAAKKYFKMWCQKHACITPKGIESYSPSEDEGDLSLPYATPVKDDISSDLKTTNSEVKKKIDF